MRSWSLRKYLPEIVIIVFLVLFSGFLRFKNLGYSDYIGDEFKAMLIPLKDQGIKDFFLTQRKGPMQFLVSYIPYLFSHDYKNEFLTRLPFSIASVLSVVVFYLLLKKLTKNTPLSFFSSIIFMVNGFIVGFGRIVQYQSLNLLFSFLALFFYSSLVRKDKHLIRDSLLGTIFWCLSFLSHWDAIFIFVPVLWVFISFLFNKKFSKGYKIRVVLYNIVLGCLLLLPFLIPYVSFHRTYDPSVEYFSRRISFGESNRDLYKLYIDLYNPFLTFWFLVAFSVLGLIKIKKSAIYLVWFLFNFALFDLFARKPGTHIYNFLIPIFILCGFGYEAVINFFFNTLKAKILGSLVTLLLLFPLAFFYYQSSMVFVDHKDEYPWDRKYVLKIDLKCKAENKLCEKVEKDYLNLRTEKYYYSYKGEKLPLFGFPHKRYWKEINDFVNEQNLVNNEKFGHATNEDPVISRGYMDVDYKSVKNYYFVGVKNPTNFVEDINPPGAFGSKTVKTIKSEEGDSIVKIFRVISVSP